MVGLSFWSWVICNGRSIPHSTPFAMTVDSFQATTLPFSLCPAPGEAWVPLPLALPVSLCHRERIQAQSQHHWPTTIKPQASCSSCSLSSYCQIYSLSTKPQYASRGPFTFFWCMYSSISLDIQTEFCMRRSILPLWGDQSPLIFFSVCV